MIASKKAEGLYAGLTAEDIGGEAEGGWGDDDDVLNVDDDMGDDFKDAEAGSDAEGDGWGAEDDIEIPADMEATPIKEDPSRGQDDGYFVVPVRGVSPTQHWCNNSSLPVDHILAGNVESACRLLHDQVGVMDFTQYNQHFMAIFSRSRASFTGLPGLPSLSQWPLSNWKEAGPKNGLPLRPLSSSKFVPTISSV